VEFDTASGGPDLLDQFNSQDDTSVSESSNKMRTTRFFITGMLILCCGIIPACTRKRAWTGPKFTGRLLVLAEDWDLSSDLIEITPGPNSTYSHTLITSGLFEAAASPDQTRLLFSTREGLFLRDLRTGDDKKMAPYAGGTNRCLAWSPDNSRFSFRSSESHRKEARAYLYVSDLDGNKKMIWESWTGGEPSDCDVHWIAPDRLIFDRVRGHTPEQEEAGEVLLENTTTLAVLGDPVKFVDTEKTWSFEGVCHFGNAVVVSPAFKDVPVFITKSLDDLLITNPERVCSDCQLAGFAAKSCLPFFLETDFKTSTIYSLNPSNWQIQNPVHVNQVFSRTDELMINSSAKLMVAGNGDQLFLIDTESGNIEPFFPKTFDVMLNKRIIGIEPILWLEN
jgi:hypothetical protein